MKEIKYDCEGTCSKQISITVDDDNVVQSVQFIGGCNGNTQGICRLVKGMKAQEVIERLKGTLCKDKGTSCPDQLAQALAQCID